MPDLPLGQSDSQRSLESVPLDGEASVELSSAGAVLRLEHAGELEGRADDRRQLETVGGVLGGSPSRAPHLLERWRLLGRLSLRLGGGRQFRHADDGDVGQRQRCVGVRCQRELSFLLVAFEDDARTLDACGEPLDMELDGILESHLAGDVHVERGRSAERHMNDVGRQNELELHAIRRLPPTVEAICVGWPRSGADRLLNNHSPLPVTIGLPCQLGVARRVPVVVLSQGRSVLASNFNPTVQRRPKTRGVDFEHDRVAFGRLELPTRPPPRRRGSVR